MTVPRPLLVLAAALAMALFLAVPRAHASFSLGSPEPDETPDGFVCGVMSCPAGSSVGFRQFALQGSDVVAFESGVVTSARVNAKRLAGAAQPRIAVLRAADGDDIGVAVGDFAPLPVTSRDSAVHEVQDLHL